MFFKDIYLNLTNKVGFNTNLINLVNFILILLNLSEINTYYFLIYLAKLDYKTIAAIQPKIISGIL